MEIVTRYAESVTEVDPANEVKKQTSCRCLTINRWMGLSAAMMMMGCSGLTYTYAVYSEFIKKSLHFSQERTDDLGAAKDFGAIFGLASGLCYFLFPPWASVFIGAVMHFLGYAVILFTLTGRMQTPFWLLCFSYALGTGGDNFIDTACIMTILESFNEDKGSGVGILKSQLGLSAAIFVMLYEAFLGSNIVNFIVLITTVPSIVYGGLAFLIRPYTSDDDEKLHSDTSQRFKAVSIFVLVLGIFLMGAMTLEEAFEEKALLQKCFATLMLFLMAGMFLAPVVQNPIDHFKAIFWRVVHVHKNVTTKFEPISDVELDDERALLNSEQPLSVNTGNETLLTEVGEEMVVEGPNHKEFNNINYPSAWESLLGINFWLITFVVSSGAGSGLAIMNNFAQIGKAVRSDGVDAFVGIISIWSCFGRILSGYGSDRMLSVGYTRPFCLLIAQIAMCICCILLATGSSLFLFIGSAVIGLAYGSYWTLAPTIISEVFGLKQVAILYKLLGLGPTLAAYVLSGKVLGYLYDQESIYYKEHHHDAEDNVCYGRRCFEFGLYSLASVCFVGVVACLWFSYRTRKLYSRIVHMHTLK